MRNIAIMCWRMLRRRYAAVADVSDGAAEVRGFSGSEEVLHKNSIFAAFGAVK